MARTQARILCTTWDDPDFLALDQAAQRMYLFLISQRDLNHAGLLPLRIRRWASKAPDLTADDVQAILDRLEADRFILTDADTEELLIRTLVRNDGVYKQPRVMIRMREDAKQIGSPRLVAAFRAEMERLPLHELSDQPSGRNGDEPSVREVVWGIVRSLLEAMPEPSPDPPPTPSTGVSDTHTDTPDEGSTEPPYVRAPAFLLPPSSVPHPPATTLVAATPPRRGAKTALPDDWAPTDDHRKFAEEHGVDLAAEVFAFRNHAAANDRRQVRWGAAFNTWLANASKWAPRNSPTRSTTDDRVNGWLALAQPPEPPDIFGEIA